MRSSWVIQAGPNPMTNVLIRREDTDGRGEVDGEEAMGRQRQGLEGCGHMPRDAQGHQKPERAEKIPPQASGGRLALLTT